MVIEREMIEQLWVTISEEFGADAIPTRWSFFFAGDSRDAIAGACLALEALGYEFIGFLEPSDDDEHPDILYGQVDQLETHTPDSLYLRCLELHKHGLEFGLQFDGVDVSRPGV